MNVDFAYILGVYMSDGSAHRHKRNWIISLTAVDKDFVEESLKSFEAVIGKEDTPIYPEDREGQQRLWKFSIYSKDFVLLLWDMTDHKTKLPESIKYAGVSEKLSFIAGFFDGDGYVSYNKRGQYQIGFVNIEEWVKNDFPSLLQSVGIKVTNVSTRWPNTDYNASKPIHRVNVNVKSFVASGGYSKIKRKHDRIRGYREKYQHLFTDAEKQRRYKRLKSVSPSETIGF